MKKSKQQPRRSKNTSKTPLIILGASVLVISLALYFLPRLVPSPAPSERNAANPLKNAGIFQEDGLLTFQNSEGSRIAGISIEIADTDEKRTLGLMGRTMLHHHQGMLFLFDDVDIRSFWMANTPLPLDILFVGPDRRIVKIHHTTTPYSEESLVSEKPAQYVVEVNAGYCRRNGIKEGDVISWLRK